MKTEKQTNQKVLYGKCLFYFYSFRDNITKTNICAPSRFVFEMKTFWSFTVCDKVYLQLHREWNKNVAWKKQTLDNDATKGRASRIHVTAMHFCVKTKMQDIKFSTRMHWKCSQQMCLDMSKFYPIQVKVFGEALSEEKACSNRHFISISYACMNRTELTKAK